MDEDQWDFAGAETQPEESVPDPVQQAFAEAQRQQAIAQGLRSGQLRYTPQQKQQLSRNSQARAWLLSGEVPDDVRDKELAVLSDADRRIIPVPTPPDEIPVSPAEQLGTQTFVDRTGQFGRPGTTWVLDPKTRKWDVSRNAPNNDVTYGTPDQSSQGPGGQFDRTDLPSGPGTGWSTGPAGLITIQGAAMAGPPMGVNPSGPSMSPVGQIGEGRMWRSAKTGLWMTLDQHGRPIPIQGQDAADKARLQREQQQRALEEKQRQQQSADRSKMAKEINDEYHRQLKAISGGEEPGYALTEEDHRKAWDMAQKIYWQTQRAVSPETTERGNAYQEYLRQKFSGLPTLELERTIGHAPSAEGGMPPKTTLPPERVAEIKAELSRRNPDWGSGPASAPEEWQPTVPVPQAAVPLLRDASPQALAVLQKHALQEPEYSKTEFRRRYPKASYQQYQQLRRYIQSDPNMEEIQQLRAEPRPEPPAASPSWRPNVNPSPPPGGAAQPALAGQPPALDLPPGLSKAAMRLYLNQIPSGAFVRFPDGTVKRKP